MTPAIGPLAVSTGCQVLGVSVLTGSGCGGDLNAGVGTCGELVLVTAVEALGLTTRGFQITCGGEGLDSCSLLVRAGLDSVDLPGFEDILVGT